MAQLIYKIRKAELKDISRIKIFLSNFSEFEDTLDDITNLNEYYFDKNGAFYFNIDPLEKIVGTFGFFEIDDNTCEIKRVHILPTLITKGVVAKNIRFLITTIIEKGYNNIVIDKKNLTEQEILLYENFGFKVVDKNLFLKLCDL